MRRAIALLVTIAPSVAVADELSDRKGALLDCVYFVVRPGLAADDSRDEMIKAAGHRCFTEAELLAAEGNQISPHALIIMYVDSIIDFEHPKAAQTLH